MKSIMRKMTADMTIDEKIAILLSEPDVEITIDNRFWDLSEEFGSDIAYRFKQKIYDIRGGLRRKLTIPEVEELYDQFKKNGLVNYGNDEK